MMHPSSSLPSIPGVRRDVIAVHSPANQAFRVLHFAFVVAPVVAGLDKLTHLLVNWDNYLAPAIARLLPFSAHTFMLFAGGVEIVAGLLVALKPSVGGVVVGLWLLGIIGNLLLTGTYYDIALRDLGLALSAFALSRLAVAHERGGLDVTYRSVPRR